MREQKKFSQGDIKNGLLRCYISRVENGYTVTAIEMLENLARGLEVLLYQLFYDGDEPPNFQIFPNASRLTISLRVAVVRMLLFSTNCTAS